MEQRYLLLVYMMGGKNLKKKQAYSHQSACLLLNLSNSINYRFAVKGKYTTSVIVFIVMGSLTVVPNSLVAMMVMM